MTDNGFPGNGGPPAFEIKLAEREGTPVLIALTGMSRAGKTYSALRMARGLVGDKGKIVLIDTENRRAKVYSDLSAPWHHMDFQPPFNPPRYTDAMAAAEQAGADCIIIDSASHVWEGEGGVLDMAAANPGKGLQTWLKPKTAYKRMFNRICRAPVHVIFCLRDKRKFGTIKDQRGKDVPVELGTEPICEKSFPYEMTALVRLQHEDDNTPVPAHTVVMARTAESLAPLFPVGEMITEDTGRRLIEWVKGGKPVDQRKLAVERDAREAATGGSEALKAHWKGLDAAAREIVKGISADLRSIADDADRQAAEASQSAAQADEPFPETDYSDPEPEAPIPAPEVPQPAAKNGNGADNAITVAESLISAFADADALNIEAVWQDAQSALMDAGADAEATGRVYTAYQNRLAEIS